MAIPRNLGRTEEAGHRIPGGPAPPRLSTRLHRQPAAVAATAGLTVALPTAPVVNYRGSACALVCWSSLLTPEEPPHATDTHSGSRATAASSRKQVGPGSTVAFVREHTAHLSREAVLLYFFLSAVADKHGLSFYGDGTMATLLRMNLPALIAARDELLAHDLIAHETALHPGALLAAPLASAAATSPAEG